MKLNKRGLILINEMISTKSFLIKTLPIVLIVFSISLTENLQIADGFSSGSTAGMKYDLGLGETQVQKWEIYNSNQTTHLEFSATNPGSEFFTFEKNVVLEPNEYRAFDFIVSIPSDHPNNIKYIVELIAKEVKPATEGGSASVLIAYQMIARPSISIGDNPIYTQPAAPVIEEKNPEPITPEQEIKEEDFGAVEVMPMESIEEKLARIQEANQPKEVIVDDVFEEEAVPELQVDDDYLEEPIADPEPITQPIIQEEKIECDFIAMILSWFGMGKC